MTISDQMERFARQRGNHVVVEYVPWCYYRLGAGTAVLWLTGGLRRAAIASAFLERLATRHTVIAPTTRLSWLSRSSWLPSTAFCTPNLSTP